MPEGGKISPLSNWPRYAGGAIAGGLIAVAGIVLFLIPSLRSILFAVPILLALIWVLHSRRSGE
jgi:hypothetical protein